MTKVSQFLLLSLLGLFSAIMLAKLGSPPHPATAASETRAFLPAISRAFAPGVAPYGEGTGEPMNVTAIVDRGDGTLLVALKEGRVMVVDSNGTMLPDPLLDIRAEVQAWPFEAGLLGLALHPDFDQNGFLYVYYTDGTQNEIASNIVRFTVAASGKADPDSALLLLRFQQPAVIHQGGDLQFGPQDGYLYISVGDGGTPNDRAGNAQSLTSLLGKILRVDVDGGTPYTIPGDNPFAGDSEKQGEIWAWGLRNPWRISFDQLTGDLFIGEVGQGAWEEINLVPAGESGLNFGWPCYEGNDPYHPEKCGPDLDLTWPIFAYIHEQTQYHCSVTGGFVYHGARMPELVGHYLFADYCAGSLWSLARDGDDQWSARNWGDMGRRWTTFGQRSDGELFLGATSTPTIYQIVPEGLPPTFPAAQTAIP